MPQRYYPVIGMEVHAQLQTASKMFCGCSADYWEAPPNTHVCPVCLGMPGVLPVINAHAVEQTVRTGLALNCRIARFSVFARKNYHYPDLPKGYQISQYELPLCRDGWLTIVGDDGQPKRIGIRRAHLEEDTGKSLHVDGHSLIDLNRAGVPLLEIVTEADMASAEEAYRYLVKLRTILRTLGVNSGDMEKGAMRCEVNLSLRTAEQAARGEYGVKVEIKNLNSFKAVRDSIAYEIARQTAVLEAGGRVEQVTMGWDENRRRTVLQRTKESSEDYRYFPEPDLPPLELSPEWIQRVAATLPELPDARAARFTADYGLTPRDAGILTAERAVADWFEQAVQAYGGPPREVANWITGPLFAILRGRAEARGEGDEEDQAERTEGGDIASLPIGPADLAALIKLVDAGVVNRNTGKRVLEEMVATGRPAAAIVEAQGLAQVSDESGLAQVVDAVLAANPGEVAKYRAGKTSVLGWFMGQVMRETRGKANPDVVRRLLSQRLDG
ncbi:MAG: Asp-tRNA(Asn)/Glu-tRNA(Gln) amidotransferase subunit GatB [Caldilineales bacterium]|nr:Asp-tRNA(Asn)/Glu-tRNA(Gln) amidotransferase subunit GatB [Caldilineales bacterium]MDW8316931.1 Asp-tRNA(Asn)/Glu-tRNA(Gln) amidotransferase subunit GatB [Anaerolineae bacterium]